MKKKLDLWVILTGVVIGASAVLLTALGNPGNMGFCIACFLRDITGSLGLHSAAAVQTFRPEIVGLMVGALLMALARKEYQGKGGSSPMTRFILGVFVMIGALMFLGCPLRMVIRLGGGDLNALLGILGFVGGILVGVLFLKIGFSLRRAYRQSGLEGVLLPAALTVLFVLSLLVPALFHQSTEGPGAKAAPWIAALLIGLVVGALCQRSRLCMAGGIRDVALFRDFHLISGFLAIFVTVLVGNLIVKGGLSFSFADQPVAHTDGLWNFLGMALVGWASILLGGCPLRQLILTGEGNSDSAVTVLGMIFGAALCHNFALASSADGPTVNGKIAVLVGFAVVLLISAVNTFRKKEA